MLCSVDCSVLFNIIQRREGHTDVLDFEVFLVLERQESKNLYGITAPNDLPSLVSSFPYRPRYIH